MEFKRGDVVILISGGPTMTVRNILENPGIVVCDLFDGTNEHRQLIFFTEQLIVVPVPQSGVSNG